MCRPVLAAFLCSLVLPSTAAATWSVVAVDLATGRIVIASATCVNRDDAFLRDVQATQIQIEQRITDVRARRTAATGAEAERFQALERRLSAGRDAPRGKLGGIARTYNGTGAQQGSFFPPTTLQRQTLAEAKAELAAIEKELKK